MVSQPGKTGPGLGIFKFGQKTGLDRTSKHYGRMTKVETVVDTRNRRTEEALQEDGEESGQVRGATRASNTRGVQGCTQKVQQGY